MSSRKLKSVQRKQAKTLKRQRRLKRKEAESPRASSIVLIEPPGGMEKMSDVLENFVEPYTEGATTVDDFRYLLTLGAAAWNSALLPEDEQKAAMDAVFREHRLPDADQRVARSILLEMIDRKKTYFSANRRYIVSVVLKGTGDGYHLSVVSSLPMPPTT